MSEEHTADTGAKSRYEEIRGLKPLRQGTFLGEEGEKFYVAKSEEEVYELSPLAYYVWLLCDGEHTVEDVANTISSEVNMPLEDIVEPLVEVLESLHGAQLVVY
ncbi:PqqD family protein [Thermogladius sp. KZ2Tp1]|uniref:PqqD family protein n=1 Tax=Thermogladius sp. KZ2Tp1 TaxID=3136289 RepID=UPI003DA9C660